MITLKRSTAAVIAAVVVFLLLGTGAAYAVNFLYGGSAQSAPRDTMNDAAWWAPTTGAWVDVPFTAVGVSVPSGTTRRVRSHFQAESQCLGVSWCTARAVIVNSAGAVTEMRPASGTDFAFDSVGGTWESHSMLRTSPWIGAGNYTVKIQVATVGAGAGATYRLDDYTHRTDTISP